MYRDELTQIAQTVWESVLQMPLEPIVAERGRPEVASLTAIISISGAWNGHVAATLSESLGRKIAGTMFEAVPESLTREDVFDALREVINMLGGNVKALLPAPCQLSLPLVAAGSMAEMSFGHRPVEESIHFQCQDQALEITLWAGPTEANRTGSVSSRLLTH